jgi:hypothetical protein
MISKNKIGGLIILGGIALIGLYWFKKNKPTLASSQAKELEALNNFYKTGGTDEPLIKGVEVTPSSNISLANIKDYKSDLALVCDGDGFLAKKNNIDCTNYCKENPTKCGGKSLVDWEKIGKDFCKQNPTLCP